MRYKSARLADWLKYDTKSLTVSECCRCSPRGWASVPNVIVFPPNVIFSQTTWYKLVENTHSKTMAMKVKVFVLAAAQSRKNDRGEYLHNVVCEEGGNFKPIHYPVKFQDCIVKDHYYLLVGVSVGDLIRLSDTSRVRLFRIDAILINELGTQDWYRYIVNSFSCIK